MDDFEDKSVPAAEISSTQPEPAENELSHTDKLVGIFTEPSKTFESMSNFTPRTIDWLLPFLLLLVVLGISTLIIMSNPTIAYEVKRQQLERIEKDLQESVKKGELTEQEAQQRMDLIESQMERFSGTTTQIISIVSIFVFGFIALFIVSGVYFLLSRFIMKGTGSYVSALVANGMTAYIGIIQVILATILALMFERVVRDVSLASILNSDKTAFTGFLLAKLDVISIWSYIILGIGLGKMFKSKSVGKFIAAVFVLWILWGLVVFFLGKSFPFLQNLG